MSKAEIRKMWNIAYAQWVHDPKDNRELVDVYVDFVDEVSRGQIRSIISKNSMALNALMSDPNVPKDQKDYISHVIADNNAFINNLKSEVSND